MRVLSEAEWRPLAEAHTAQVRKWTEPRLRRRRNGEKHPVDDFLWEYYRFSPGKLAVWHPGWGTALAGTPAVAGVRHYHQTLHGWSARADTATTARLRRNLAILRATDSRPAKFGCFGLHEWAMVHDAEARRHNHVPLRVSAEGVTRTVHDLGLRCTHFDAYRFFTPSAAPLQRPLTRDSQIDDEQPGCIHAGMDLYRYAYEAAPFVGSHLVVDCLQHARAARRLDMQASPYDLSSWGLDPVPVDTAEGRQIYSRRQRDLAGVAGGLRRRLIASLDACLASASHRSPDPAESP